MSKHAGTTYAMDSQRPTHSYRDMANAALVDAVCGAVFDAVRKYIPEYLLNCSQHCVDDDIRAAVVRFFPKKQSKHKVDNIVLFVGAKCITNDISELEITDRKEAGIPLFLGEFRDGSKVWYTITGEPENPQETPPQRRIISVINDEDRPPVATPSSIDIKLFVGAECEREDGILVKIIEYVDTPQDCMCEPQNAGRFVAVRSDGLGVPSTYNLFGQSSTGRHNIVRVINASKE